MSTILVAKTMLFFDVVGTLIYVKGSVGGRYSMVAQSWGVVLEPTLIQQRFGQVMGAFPRLDFRSHPPDFWENVERDWWYRLVWQVVQGEQFRDFAGFFDQLWLHFAQGSTWSVYPEVKAVLTQLKAQGIPLVAVTNFDSRVLRVLADLDLDSYFQRIVYSAQVGSAKPEAEIFLAALAGQDPATVLHIGDSWTEDVLGAEGVGIRALWLQRDTDATSHPRRITSLRDLLLPPLTVIG